MYCKNCNRAIDNDAKSCPYCGTLLSFSGGNGIWSTARLDTSAKESDTVNERHLQEAATETVQKPHREEMNRTKRFPLIQALTIFCFLILLVGIFSLKSSVAELEDKLEVAETTLTEANTQLADRLSLAEREISEYAVTPAPGPKVDFFTKNPTDEEQEEGSNPTIFTVEFYPNFSDYSTFWEKQTNEGTEFLKLTYGELSKLGLSESKEISEEEAGTKCTCKLKTDALQENSDGVYRLGVYTKEGDLVACSGEARLTVIVPATDVVSEISQEEAHDET